MNRDHSDKICRHLIEMEKLSPSPEPPPLQSSISMASLGRAAMCAQKEKGMHTQA